MTISREDLLHDFYIERSIQALYNAAIPAKFGDQIVIDRSAIEMVANEFIQDAKDFLTETVDYFTHEDMEELIDTNEVQQLMWACSDLTPTHLSACNLMLNGFFLLSLDNQQIEDQNYFNNQVREFEKSIYYYRDSIHQANTLAKKKSSEGGKSKRGYEKPIKTTIKLICENTDCNTTKKILNFLSNEDDVDDLFYKLNQKILISNIDVDSQASRVYFTDLSGKQDRVSFDRIRKILIEIK
ncbi:MAG: hypothetical protein OEY38_22270 [Gammaproteobacteria bacterium]|nr:hypothetical protein [Gammaproteobacteria bacterium]